MGSKAFWDIVRNTDGRTNRQTNAAERPYPRAIVGVGNNIC